jgi:hypothetical protein
MFVTRVYNNFDCNPERGTLTKRSTEAKLGREIAYYNLLPLSLKVHYPRMIDYHHAESDGQEYSMEMEYYPYQNMGDALLMNWQSPNVIEQTAEHLLGVLEQFKTEGLVELLPEDLIEMYITKTEREYQRLVDDFYGKTNQTFFSDASKHDSLRINGVEYRNFKHVWPEVKDYVLETLCASKRGHVIHGDMCLSNMLFAYGIQTQMPVVKLIDPRGSFGPFIISGDAYYDLAKMHHSTNTGYELIINDKFNLKTPLPNNIEFTFESVLQEHKANVHDIFSKVIYEQYDVHRIKTIEALQYIAMAGRHYDSLERQIVMYASGIKLLNEVCL